jgi:hypothetical protein
MSLMNKKEFWRAPLMDDSDRNHPDNKKKIQVVAGWLALAVALACAAAITFKPRPGERLWEDAGFPRFHPAAAATDGMKRREKSTTPHPPPSHHRPPPFSLSIQS